MIKFEILEILVQKLDKLVTKLKLKLEKIDIHRTQCVFELGVLKLNEAQIRTNVGSFNH